MKHIAANALTVLIVLGLGLAGLVGWAASEFRAPGPHEEVTTVVIPAGAGLNTISGELAEAGVISDQRLFRLGARYRGEAGAIRFGEYEVPARASMEQVLALLIEGRTIQHRFTAPEGLTSWEIVERLKDVDVLTGEVEGLPPEGALAPDTYFVQRGESRETIVARMTAAQEAILSEAWENRQEDLPLSSPEEALVLASIIEKETGVAEERRRVAAVFVNRLRLGMRLQTDPTVIYGITQGQGSLGRGLRRSELDAPTPYNTYVIRGLPPTPIANPGRASIEAALNPLDTEEIYFVADGTGGHAFATNLADHNRNVARWRRIEAERAQQ